MTQKYQLSDLGRTTRSIHQGVGKLSPDLKRAPTVEDIQSSPPYGLPPDWDYKTAELGPAGEQPYKFQKGWDAVGRRYYGSGFVGAGLGAWSRMLAPIGRTPELTELYKPVTVTGGGGAVGLYSAEPGTAVQAFDIGTAVNTLTARASNLGRVEGTEVGFNVQSVPTLFGRGASETVRNIVSLLQQPAILYKRYVGGVAAGLAEAGATSPLPYWTPDLSKSPIKQFQDIKSEVFPRLDPVGLSYNALRTITSGRSLEEIGDILNLNIQAGRMFYTSALDPMAKQEFLRRYAAGEDPTLLAIELENPLYEAIGEIVFDPLNIPGFAFLRPARDARRIASASDEFIKFSDDGVRVAFEGLGNVSGEGRAVEAVDNLAKAQLTASNATRAGLDGFAKDTSVFALTATGKRFNVARRSEQLLGWIAANASGPEETLEIYRGLALANSGDPQKIALGIDILNNFKVPRPLYSRAGNEAGVLLNDLIGDDPVKFLDELSKVSGEARKTGDIAPLVTHMEKKLSPIIDKMFPTITERVAAGEEVSGALQAIARFDGVVRSKIMRPLNSFFSAIYMGMSPGYATRNLLTNSLHVFVDEGPGAFRFGPQRWLNEATDWLGGRIPKAIGFGPVAAADVKTSKKLWNTFMRVSENFEIGASKRVIGHSVQQTMRKMLQPGRAIPNVKPLIDAGMPEDAANLLMRLVADNRGNLKKADRIFREAVKTGSIESFRNVSKWATPEDLAALHNFGLFDDVNDALKLGNADDAAAALSKHLDDFRAEAAKVQFEPSAIPDESAMKVDAAALGGAREAGYLSDEVVSATQSRYIAADNAIGEYQSAAGELARQAYYTAGQQAVPTEQVQRIAQGYQGILDGGIEQLARRERTKFWDVTWRQSDEIRSMPNDTDWASVWRRVGLDGEPPVGLSRKQLLNAFWDDYARPTVDRMVQATRDSIAIGSEAFAREMGAITGVPPNTPLLQRARQSYLLSVQFDNAQILRDNRIYNFGVGGELFEVRVGEGIDNTKHLLNAINDNLPKGVKPFDTLHNVPPEIARRALRQRADLRAREVLEAAGELTVEDLVAKGMPEDMAKTIIESVVPPSAVRSQGNIPLAGRWFTGDLGDAQNYVRLKAEAGRPGAVITYVDIPESELARYNIRNVLEELTPLEQAEAMTSQRPGLDYILSDDLTNTRKVWSEVASAPPEGTVRIYRAESGINLPTEITPLVPPLAPGAMPTHARAIHENLPGIEQLFGRVEEGMRSHWGELEAVAPWGDEAETALGSWLKDADGRIAEARLTAEAVSQQARDFTLLLYPEKRNIDLALSYIYPYNFWYSRTYANWLKRIVSNPEVIANYGRYKEYLAKIHAGAPEWWKYQINSNELLGLESENPLFFNLEATLNPVNGLTGIDFDDPYKRTGWFTTMLQDAGKLGPSVWTPYSIAVALALYMKGENEASARWAGRLFPQTATIRAAFALATGKPLELDPFVHFFSGGVGPYERRRAGRALAAMDNEHKYGTADILDAAYFQKGPIWDEALLREATERGPGQLASFFLGVGFKARSKSDLEIDRFYGDWMGFWAQEPNYSPEEVRLGVEALRKKYPFMDTLLLSRKGGLERDRTFAYNVLGRIPPAQTDDFAALVGVPGELLSRFYDDKGHIERWPETDRDRFMAGILDLAAVLDMPNEATRGEWNEARSAYRAMQLEGERRFGDDIWSRVDAYFGAKGETPAERDMANRILSLDPAIGQALDWKSSTIMRSPTLSAYYNSIEKVEQYYKGLMYAAIEKELGKDIWEKWDVYHFFKDSDPKEARAFWKANPELAKYIKLRDKWLPIAEQKAIEVGRLLPEGQGATLREIEGELGIGAQNVAQNFPAVSPGQVTPEMWQQALGKQRFRLVLDFILNDDPLPQSVIDSLDELAANMGILGGAEGLAQSVAASIPSYDGPP